MNYLLIAGAVLGVGLLLWDPIVSRLPKRKKISGFDRMLEEFLACPDTTSTQRDSIRNAMNVLVSHRVKHQVNHLIPKGPKDVE